MQDKLEKIGDYWSNFHSTKRVKLSWLESKVVENFINKRMTGSESKNWVCELKRLHAKPFKRALIVGCGVGQLERDLIRAGLIQTGVGVDIAKLSLDIAIKTAETENLSSKLNYKHFNLEAGNYKELGRFDIVIIQMVAHHIHKLDYFFGNLQKLLSESNGVIVLYEYVGPNRFWHNDRTVNIINQLLDGLDDEYKKNHLVSDGSLRREYIRTPIEHFLEHDPSEAIRSQDILKKLKKYFLITKIYPCGGQINHMLLTGITENLDRSKCGKQILKLLMVFEVILEEAGVIGSDFAVIFARPKRLNFFNSLKINIINRLF